MTIAAVHILNVPYIQAAGAILLMWIALKLLVDEEGHSDVRQASTLGGAVWTIILADFVMSLDNVLAIAAKANNDTAVIILGIGLSIPIIVWGSTLVMKLLNRYPVFVYLGAAILGYTAGEMFVNDQKMHELVLAGLPNAHHVIPAAATIVVVVAGILKKMLFSSGNTHKRV